MVPDPNRNQWDNNLPIYLIKITTLNEKKVTHTFKLVLQILLWPTIFLLKYGLADGKR